MINACFGSRPDRFPQHVGQDWHDSRRCCDDSNQYSPSTNTNHAKYEWSDESYAYRCVEIDEPKGCKD